MAGTIHTSDMAPPGARNLRLLMQLSYWSTGTFSGTLLGCLALLAAHATRAVWTTMFLAAFGMDPWLAGTLAVSWYALLLPVALFYHMHFFSEPHLLHRLLCALDSDGSRLQRLEQKAKRGIFVGFFMWGISWCITWWLVFGRKYANQDLFLALLPMDFLLGRALEHKVQFFSLYIREVHMLLSESVKEFEDTVDKILGAKEEPNCGPLEIYEQLHQAECKMRSYMKWNNDLGSLALLAYMAQEACSAVYTASIAWYVHTPQLEFGLLAYSVVQLIMLLRTALDVAKPGDTFWEACQNLDTPRMLGMLQVKLQGSDRGIGSAVDYMRHLYRAPAGVYIWYTLVRTPVVVKLCVTLALPTLLVLFQTLLGYMAASEEMSA